jgi:hypothetical protein
MHKILDLFGRRADRGLVDTSGNQISTEPQAEQPGDPSRKGAFIPTGQVEIKGILIACLCSDGLFRMVAFSDKETRKVTRIIKQMHQGSIRLKEKPVLVVRELVGKQKRNGDVEGGSGSPREIGDSGESPLPGNISRGEPLLPERRE